ncbi:hypothetical protein [Endozoicomonas lisbonensis]|uniref:Uncharacterized protein n=1 Tax=Endozoicomonas lisbonensis TaxID=3120522 RepID=A0ABV2SKX5_9GAMM
MWSTARDSKGIVSAFGKAFFFSLLFFLSCLLLANTSLDESEINPGATFSPYHSIDNESFSDDVDNIRSALLEIFIKREALFRAALFMVRPSYKNKTLTCDDLKQIFKFTFAAVHMTDDIYFPLKNAYASATYLNGAPFRPDLIPGWSEQDYELSTLHQGSLREKYFSHDNICNQADKTLDDVMEQVINPLYKERLSQFKKRMNLGYDAPDKYQSNQYIISKLNYAASSWIFYERLTMIREAYYQSGLYHPCNKRPDLMCRLNLSTYNEKPVEEGFWAFIYKLKFLHELNIFGYLHVFSSLISNTRDSLGLPALEKMLKTPFGNLDQYSHSCKVSTVVDSVAERLPFYLDRHRPIYGLAKAGANLHKLAQLSFSDLEVFAREQAIWSAKLIEQSADIRAVARSLAKH